MFLQKLMSQTSAPVLEQMLQFTEARAKLLTENVANVDTAFAKAQGLGAKPIVEPRDIPDTGRFAVYTMAARPDGRPGVFVRKHDAAVYRAQEPVK